MATVLCALLMATAASAQFEVNPTARGQAKPKRLEVSGFIGMLSVNQSLGTATNIYQTVTGEAENIDFGKLLGFRASWAFTPMISAEFNVSRGNNPYSFSVDDDTIGTEKSCRPIRDRSALSGWQHPLPVSPRQLRALRHRRRRPPANDPDEPDCRNRARLGVRHQLWRRPQALASKPGMAGRTRRPALSHGDGRHHVSWRLVDAERTRAHHRRFLYHFSNHSAASL